MFKDIVNNALANFSEFMMEGTILSGIVLAAIILCVLWMFLMPFTEMKMRKGYEHVVCGETITQGRKESPRAFRARRMAHYKVCQ